MKVGDWIKVIKQSVKYNAHIRTVGYVGTIDHIEEDTVYITCLNGGMGNVDLNCVEIIEEPEYSEKIRLSQVH